MLIFMKDSRFDIAFRSAEDVLNNLKLDKNELVTVDRLVDVVSKLTDTKIVVREIDFRSVVNDCEYGAMMCVTKNNNKKSALIVLNSNKNIDDKFRRFSLAHELGHLVTEKYNFAPDDQSFTVSTHINFDLNEVDEQEYNANENLLNEEIANIFALCVLIPLKTLIYALVKYDRDTERIAEYFGVTETAIKSRLDLI